MVLILNKAQAFFTAMFIKKDLNLLLCSTASADRKSAILEKTRLKIQEPQAPSASAVDRRTE